MPYNYDEHAQIMWTCVVCASYACGLCVCRSYLPCSVLWKSVVIFEVSSGAGLYVSTSVL